eukprot:SAG22_NODE_1015_length_6025_cov_3.431320_2_plen_89_part_00
MPATAHRTAHRCVSIGRARLQALAYYAQPTEHNQTDRAGSWTEGTRKSITGRTMDWPDFKVHETHVLRTGLSQFLPSQPCCIAIAHAG